MPTKYLNKIKDIFKSYESLKNFQRIAGGCRVIDVQEGRVKVEFDVKEEHTNPFGTLHGGFSASIVDIVTTTAIMATPHGHPGVSVDLCVSYLGPAQIGDTVIVDASVTKLGRSLGFTRADLFRKADNRPIATALHTKAFPKAKSNL